MFLRGTRLEPPRAGMTARIRHIGRVFHEKAGRLIIAGSYMIPGTVNSLCGGRDDPDARIPERTIVTTAVMVEHYCKIGLFCHISPRVVLAGGASVAALSWIGAKATIRESRRVGE